LQRSIRLEVTAAGVDAHPAIKAAAPDQCDAKEYLHLSSWPMCVFPET
jgi:hypothetical protein